MAFEELLTFYLNQAENSQPDRPEENVNMAARA